MRQDGMEIKTLLSHVLFYHGNLTQTLLRIEKKCDLIGHRNL